MGHYICEKMRIGNQLLIKKVQKKIKKTSQNIWSVRKKAVPLQPISR
jgi:hypothetical protein